MEPTLVDGQGIIGWETDRVRRDQLRCVEHPERSGFWLVKRVESVEGASMRVVSDNSDVEAVDSRRFGPVPVAGSYRVVLRVPRGLT